MAKAERVFLLTGATGVIGGRIAVGLAKHHNATLILACRDSVRGAKLASAVMKESGNQNVAIELVDLDSNISIKRFAVRFRERYGGRLDVLVNNASVVPSDRQVAKQTGLEMQLQVNVLAYFLMMTELRPALAVAANAVGDARIVNVCSDLAGGLDISDLNFEKRQYNGSAAYKQSKQAERMLSWEASRQFARDGISVTACHPGITSSDLNIALCGGMSAHTPEQAAATPLRLATDVSLKGVTGTWFQVGSGGQSKCRFNDTQKCASLWHMCENLSATG